MIMQSPPQLTDHSALARNRRRADTFFLHDLAIAEIKERLTEVNRTFTRVAIVTGFPEVWRAAFPGALIVPEGDTLALEPGAHDLVIHAMALHWANDPVGQLVQSRRALAADGLFLSVAFGGMTLHQLRASLAQAEARVTGGLSPRVAPMAEIRDMGALLQRAGFALPVADSLNQTVSYPDALKLMRDLRAMGEANALHDRHRKPTRRGLFDLAAQIYADSFGQDGRLPATFEMIFLTGWAPADTQPKPLRPGSAKTRLADALGATETKLPGTGKV